MRLSKQFYIEVGDIEVEVEVSCDVYNEEYTSYIEDITIDSIDTELTGADSEFVFARAYHLAKKYDWQHDLAVANRDEADYAREMSYKRKVAGRCN